MDSSFGIPKKKKSWPSVAYLIFFSPTSHKNKKIEKQTWLKNENAQCTGHPKGLINSGRTSRERVQFGARTTSCPEIFFLSDSLLHRIWQVCWHPSLDPSLEGNFVWRALCLLFAPMFFHAIYGKHERCFILGFCSGVQQDMWMFFLGLENLATTTKLTLWKPIFSRQDTNTILQQLTTYFVP